MVSSWLAAALLELFMYGFTIKIKMLVSAKALPTGYLKKSAFTKHLLTYLLQQTKVFNCGLNASLKLKAFERLLSMCPAL